MKRLVILLIVLLIPASYARGSWTPFNLYGTLDADFLNAATGLVVTHDTTWKYDHGDLRKISSPRRPRQIAIQDSDVAWLACDSTLYRGTNHWSAWKPVWDSIPSRIIGVIGTSLLFECDRQPFLATRDTVIPATGLQSGDLQFLEAMTSSIAVVVGRQYVYRTTNGGASWQPLLQIAGNLPSALYADRAHGLFYMSGPLRVSSDYGVTWNVIPSPPQFPANSLSGIITGAHDCSGLYYLFPATRSNDLIRATPDRLFFDIGPFTGNFFNIYKTWTFNGGADVFVLATADVGLDVSASFDGIDGTLTDSVHTFVTVRADTLHVNFCTHPSDSLRLTLRSSTCLPIPIDSVQVLQSSGGSVKRMTVGKTLMGDSLVVTGGYTAKRIGFDSINVVVWMHPVAGRAFREGLPYTIFTISDGGAAQLAIPTTLEFGTVRADTLVAKQLTIRNTGCDDLRVDSIVSTNPTLFALTLPAMPRYIHGNDSLRIAVSYHPQTFGDDLESIEIGTNAGHRFVAVTGTVTRLHVEPDASSQFTLAPNPASDHITVDAPMRSRFTLVDAIGNTVRTGEFEPGTNDLSVRDLAAGVYLLRAEGCGSRRLVVLK